MKKEPNFQSIDIKYPKKLYAFAFWLDSYDAQGPVPLLFPRLFKNIASVKYYSIPAIENTRENIHHYLDQILVIPLVFKRKFPLKKEMWTNNKTGIGISENNIEKIEAFIKYELYDAMVTPAIVKILGEGKRLEKYIAFTMLKTATDEEIELMTKTCDIYVMPEAKNAAIYEIGEKFGYDPFKNRVIKNKIDQFTIEKLN